MTKQFVISSGHGKNVQGAIGILNEVDEARKVVNRVYEILTNSFNENFANHISFNAIINPLNLLIPLVNV